MFSGFVLYYGIIQTIPVLFICNVKIKLLEQMLIKNNTGHTNLIGYSTIVPTMKSVLPIIYIYILYEWNIRKLFSYSFISSYTIHAYN